MKRFVFNLFTVYFVFAVVSLGRDLFLMARGRREKPEYRVIIPENSREVLMEREGYYVYSGENLNLADLPGEERKEVFVTLLLPAIEVIEIETEWKRSRAEKLRDKKRLTPEEEGFLGELYSRYNIRSGDIETLIEQMIVPPRSLIISQAALESGWGTSRFFTEGNNIFGVWSYNENEPRIPAMETRENGYTAYLKSYGDLKGSVEDYILLLSRNENYLELREGLRRGEGSLKLAGYLTMYSELREEYVSRVRSVIRSNKLTELDK